MSWIKHKKGQVRTENIEEILKPTGNTLEVRMVSQTVVVLGEYETNADAISIYNQMSTNMNVVDQEIEDLEP